MQRDREVRENGNRGSPFDRFGGFGFTGSIFGGRDPFHDPFFNAPFGSLFGSNMFSTGVPAHSHRTSKPQGPIITELDSDDEEMIEGNEEGDTSDGAGWANRNPLIEHPEDQANDHGKSNNDSDNKDISYITNHNRAEGTQPRSRSVSFQRVTYGGIDGAYYTATTNRRTGNDGVTLEESKQADRTTGQASHRISRGIHDKGHSVTRKLDSDGKVDTMQTLHNLNEDELTGFEQAWSGNADRHFHSWSDSFFSDNNPQTGREGRGQLATWEGFSDPFREHFNRTDRNFQAQSSMGRPKKVVRINIE